MRVVWLLLMGFVLCGCDDAARKEVSQEGSKALQSAGKVISVGFASAMKKAKELSDDASPQVVAASKSALKAIQDQLKRIPKPSPEVQKQMDDLQNGIEKLDAQAMMRSAKDKVDELVEKGKSLGKTADEVKTKLRETDEKYRAAEKSLADAKLRYEEAKKKLGVSSN
jgi:predicted  nucleic acid-binding Zn-ribbon protein